MYDENRKSDIKAYMVIIINRQQQQKKLKLYKGADEPYQNMHSTLHFKRKISKKKIAHFPFIDKAPI